MRDRLAPDIFKVHLAIRIGARAKDADQSHAALCLEREDNRKILVLDIHVHAAIDRRPGGIDVGHIERA